MIGHGFHTVNVLSFSKEKVHAKININMVKVRLQETFNVRDYSLFPLNNDVFLNFSNDQMSAIKAQIATG